MKVYRMIGAPVTGVRTPPLLESRLAVLGIRAIVEPRHVEAADLADFMGALRSEGSVDGLLVTMPHKKSVIAHLDGLSALARSCGSVNTVKRTADGRWVGAQFDGVGLVNALCAHGIDLPGSRICVAGLGGAGLAIALAILDHGCRSLYLEETDAPLRAALARRLADDRRCVFATGEEPASGTCDVLVNATPLGMRPGDPSPFSPERIAKARLVADIVADPLATRLAALAQDGGVTLVTGRDMVMGQVAPIADWLSSPDLEQQAGRSTGPRPLT